MKYLKKFESVIDTDKKIRIITDMIKELDYEDVNIPVKTDSYDIVVNCLSYNSDLSGDFVLVYYDEIDIATGEFYTDENVNSLDDIDDKIIDAIYNYYEESISPLTFEEYFSGKDIGLL